MEAYKGDSSSSNLISLDYNIIGNKVYKGNSSSSNHMLCNIKGNKVYKEDCSSSSHMLFNSTERFSTEKLAAILFALGQI